MRKKIVFIASSPHSGSTLLDLVIGGHPSFVGLGEVCNVINPKEPMFDRTDELGCSCGRSMEDCHFWSKVRSEMQKQRVLDVHAGYKIVLECFSKIFAPNCVPVDSSKNLYALRALRETTDVDVKVIHLVRDVRAWTISMRDAYKRHWSLTTFNTTSLFKKSLRRVQRTPFYCFYRWYRENKRMAEFLKAECIPSQRIGYEELCLRTESTIRRICDFLEVEPAESMLSLINSRSHCLRGNRMRHEKERRQQIMYDCRWLCRREWLLCSLFMNRIMSFNRKTVYGFSSELFGCSFDVRRLSESAAHRAAAISKWLEMYQEDGPGKVVEHPNEKGGTFTMSDRRE